MYRPIALTAFALVLAAPLAAAAYTIKMPWRGDGLPANTFMKYFRTPHGTCPPGQSFCQLDMWAVRWDTDLQKWTHSATQGQDTTSSPQDHVGWGMDLFSPVDGEIVACWRRMPDDDGTNGAIECPGGAQQCKFAGNYVAIRTADDMSVMLAHMMQDSIDPALCPITTMYLFEQDEEVCDEIGEDWEKMLPATLVDPPRPVRKGQFIGKVGESGRSEWPHLHMHARPFACNANGEPSVALAETLEFDEPWRQEQDFMANASASDWVKMTGSGFDFPAGNHLLWSDPTGIRRDALDIEAGSEPALTFGDALGDARGSAVYINSDGHFSAVGFDVDANHSISLGTIMEKGTVFAVDAALISPSQHHLVAAVRNGSGKLQMIPYFYGANSNLDEGSVGHTSTTSVSLVKATPAPTHSGVTVAHMNTASGFLQVSNFGASVVGSTDLQVDVRGTAISSTIVSEIDVARVVAGKALVGDSGFFKGVVTAERRVADEALVLRTWSISTDGQTVTHAASAVAAKVGGGNFEVDDVDVAVVGNSAREFAVVSLREDATDELWVQTYEISSAGALTRKSEWHAGGVTALSSVKTSDRDLAIGVRDASNGLSVLSFSVDANAILGRAGTRDAGGISGVAVGAATSTGNLVVAVTNSSGDISLLNYMTHYSTQV